MVTQPNNHSTVQNPVGHFMVAAGALIQLEGTDKLLVIRRAGTEDWHGGEWEIIYGRIDQFEDLPQGLRREVREESGITELSVHEVLRVWHIFRGPEKAENEVIGITFHCVTQQEHIQLSAEHAEYRWVTPTEALELIQVPGIRADIQAFTGRENSRSGM